MFGSHFTLVSNTFSIDIRVYDAFFFTFVLLCSRPKSLSILLQKMSALWGMSYSWYNYNISLISLKTLGVPRYTMLACINCIKSEMFLFLNSETNTSHLVQSSSELYEKLNHSNFPKIIHHCLESFCCHFQKNSSQYNKERYFLAGGVCNFNFYSRTACVFCPVLSLTVALTFCWPQIQGALPQCICLVFQSKIRAPVQISDQRAFGL